MGTEQSRQNLRREYEYILRTTGPQAADEFAQRNPEWVQCSGCGADVVVDEDGWSDHQCPDPDAKAKHDALIHRAEEYGVEQTNPLSYEFRQEMEAAGKMEYVDWTDPDLLRVERFRLLTDPGFPAWDVSYCVGRMRDGSLVNVYLPFSQLPKRGGWKRALVDEAIAAGVNAKRLGFFDAASTLA